MIETPRYLLVLDVSSILLWMAYDVSRTSLVFFGITLMAVHFPGLNSICQSFPTVPVMTHVTGEPAGLCQ